MQSDRIDRRQMKLDAKAAMSEHRPSIFLIAFVFLAITAVLDWLSGKLAYPGVSSQELVSAWMDPAKMQEITEIALHHRSTGGTFLGAAIDIMEIMLSGGFLLACLNVARREAATIGTLFDAFNYFLRFLWLNILCGIFIFLWSLLLIIPGIVAAYRYSMATRIFFDNPEKGALQCIRESKELTRGYKGQLFVLDLSFLGWALLSIVPFVSIYVQPYISVTRSNYYRALRGEHDRQQRQQYYSEGTYGDPWNR